MRCFLPFAAFTCAVIIATTASTVSAQTLSRQTKAEKEVMVTVLEWAEAVRVRDVRALDKLFADELKITTFNAQMRGKTEELEVLKPRSNVKGVSVTNEDLKVKVYDRTAVATALVRMHLIVDDKDVNSAFRYTAVFVKRDGRWQMVALQSIRAPSEPPLSNKQ